MHSVFILLKGPKTPIKMSSLEIVWRAKKQMRREKCSLRFNNEFCIKARITEDRRTNCHTLCIPFFMSRRKRWGRADMRSTVKKVYSSIYLD